MLDIIMAIASITAALSIFFLCYLTHTLNEQLRNNDEVIGRLDNEISVLRASKQNMYTDHIKQIDTLKMAHKAASTLRDKYADNIRMKDEIINNKRNLMDKMKKKLHTLNNKPHNRRG
tara:strand:+ start:195 stop:548 length:354 start_codon:yes stop_codon:yes gene_type:complete